MLNFLDKHHQQSYFQRKIRRKPQRTYGISLQAPKQFQSSYPMFSNITFVSPYVKYESPRIQCIPIDKTGNLNAKWVNKTDFSRIEGYKVVGNQQKMQKISKNRYLQSYYSELKRDKSCFRRTKGQFTHFVERNISNSHLKPLQGEQRSLDKAKKTRRLLIQKSQISIHNNMPKLLNLNLTKQKLRKISPLDEKYYLRKSRQKINNTFKNNLEKRKINQQQIFLLPQVSYKLSLRNTSKFQSL